MTMWECAKAGTDVVVQVAMGTKSLPVLIAIALPIGEIALNDYPARCSLRICTNVSV